MSEAYKKPSNLMDALHHAKLAQASPMTKQREPDPIRVGDLVHRRFSAKLAILHLMGMELIPPAQYSSLYKMIDSPDEENLVVAEEIIKEKLK